MIERHALAKLRKWKNKKHRKPLILRGARQVGKTTLVDTFSAEFDSYLKLNLDREEDKALFNRYKKIDTLIDAIFLHLKKSKTGGSVLLFIDEIQNSPEAVALLRYFYEDYPEIYVIGAGSLLENTIDRKISFPVGRVEYMAIRPCSFLEYLSGIGEDIDAQAILDLKGDLIHERLMEEFRRFAIIGGMPEAINIYAETKDILAVDYVYESLITTYGEDVEKYSPNETQTKIMRHILDAGWVFGGQKIVFEKFAGSSYQSRDVGEAFRTIQKAMLLELIYPVTEPKLPAVGNMNYRPKLAWLDVGLMNYKAQVRQEVFDVTDITDAYRGHVAEQIVAQELISRNFSVLQKRNFWERNARNSTAEVDFVYARQPHLIPVEVKSGVNSKLTSLHYYMEGAPYDVAIRIWSKPLKIDEVVSRNTKKRFKLISMPYYYICILEEVLNTIL